MKILIYSILIFCIIAFVCTGCDKDKDYVKLINYTDQDIYVYDAYERDILLPSRQAELGKIINHYYKSGTYKSYTAYFDIDEELCDTLFISIISVDTLQKYSWETVFKEKMIMKRYVVPFTKEYLRSIDYTIKYRGTEQKSNLYLSNYK